MKKAAVFLFSFMLLIINLGQSVSAHVLETDGTIGAILHIEPADDPVAGEQNNFIFEFRDRAGKLDLLNCDCQFSISETGKVLTTQILDISNETTAIAQFNFPVRDNYELSVFGTPQPDGIEFQPFKLTFDLQVGRGTMTGDSKLRPIKGSFLLGINLAAVYIAGLCYVLISKAKRR